MRDRGLPYRPQSHLHLDRPSVRPSIDVALVPDTCSLLLLLLLLLLALRACYPWPVATLTPSWGSGRTSRPLLFPKVFHGTRPCPSELRHPVHGADISPTKCQHWSCTGQWFQKLSLRLPQQNKWAYPWRALAKLIYAPATSLTLSAR